MNKAHLLAIGLAALLLAAVPLSISAQDSRALGPGFYAIAIDDGAKIAWRINTANGSVSLCTAAGDPVETAPSCSAWSSTIIKEPQR